MRIEEIRSDLAGRLRDRRREIELTALTRVSAVSGPHETADPEYAEGLRKAVSAAIDYGIDALERREGQSSPLPTALLIQARLAARNRVKLETVLRGYLAGYTLLGDYLIEESVRGGEVNSAFLKRLLRVQAALFDRVIAAVSEEYARESESRFRSPERDQAERVKKLLAGELLDAPELSYDFDGHHLGAMAVGHGAAESLAGLAKHLDCRLLLVRRGEGTIWAWFGSRGPLDSELLEGLRHRDWPDAIALAVGEPGRGIPGWRLTHRQAGAALPIALRSDQGMVRYREVALLAAMLQDDLLATSLRELFLDPLQSDRDGGRVARETLRAYFTANRNISSAASALGAARHTVAKRLRGVEDRLGYRLSVVGAELEAALRIDELDRRSPPGDGP